ncbi:LPS-assembly protein LptD [Thioclava sp. BHET1]|nr:LPS-assembly protein LptD [Thioclava sp. BHET1]
MPNEDSQQTEFDEGDLWSMDRFNGIDGVELGARANVGFSWTRYDPTGWTLGVTAGRVFRQLETNQFDAASGLGAKLSDWLVAVQAKWQQFSVINRTVFGDGQGIAKNELRLEWQGKKSTLATGFISMIADTDTTSTLVGANDPTREWMVDASYKFTNNWSSQVAWRYDFVNHRADGSGIKFGWRNECVSVDLSLSRSYSSSSSVSANTTFGFSVGLIGFGGVAGGNPGMCRE